MVVRAVLAGRHRAADGRAGHRQARKKLQETPYIDKIRSYSKPGETLIFLQLRESTPPRETSAAWYQVRKKIGDIRGTLPPACWARSSTTSSATPTVRSSPSGDGFTYAEMKDYADFVRQQLLRVPLVSKVELFGVQDEKINIEFSHRKFAQLGVPSTSRRQINARTRSKRPACSSRRPTTCRCA